MDKDDQDIITIQKKHIYLAGIATVVFVVGFLAFPLVQSLIDSSGEEVTPTKTITQGPGVGEAIFKGPINAKVTIIEYSSFTCPYCNKVRSTLDQIMQMYPGQIKFVYKHFDRGGPDSKAGQAAECAREQGKFWEMHDMLFDSGAYGDLKQYATDLGLNRELFDECLDSKKYAARIRQDTQEGISFGARATPTFLINGRILVGAQPLNVFKAMIDTELEK